MTLLSLHCDTMVSASVGTVALTVAKLQNEAQLSAQQQEELVQALAMAKQEMAGISRRRGELLQRTLVSHRSSSKTHGTGKSTASCV